MCGESRGPVTSGHLPCFQFVSEGMREWKVASSAVTNDSQAPAILDLDMLVENDIYLLNCGKALLTHISTHWEMSLLLHILPSLYMKTLTKILGFKERERELFLIEKKKRFLGRNIYRNSIKKCFVKWKQVKKGYHTHQKAYINKIIWRANCNKMNKGNWIFERTAWTDAIK